MHHESNTLIETSRFAPRGYEQRFWFLYTLLGLGVALFIGRSFYLQVLHGTQFRGAAEGNRVTAALVTAPRGIIYDHEKRQLVENIASTDVVLNPTNLPSEDNETLLVETLPALLSLPPEAVQTAIASARQTQRFTRLIAGVTHDQVLALEQRQHELPGVQLVSSLVRRYSHPALAHALGYTSPISAEELAQNIDLAPTDITGKTGLEKQYDRELHGTAGFSYVEVNAAGKAQKKLEEKAPINGSHLHLTVDVELQEFIVDLLRQRAEKLEKELPAAVIALDPRSGAIRALVSYPLFDPNLFSQPGHSSEAAAVIRHELEPLFNRATDGTYPPGSTIKPLLAAAALAEGVITPQTTVASTGGLTVGQWRFPDWKAGGHGITDVTKAIAESVNTFFYLAVGGDGTQGGLGVERAILYLKKFGFGSPTGIDVPGEAKGFVPTPEWKESVKKEPWYIGDTYHLAIGQGDVLASPLQIAQATAAIANNGTLYEPFLVHGIETPDGTVTETSPQPKPLDMPASHLEIVRRGMRTTITDGSGASLNSLPVAVAGKTGTAQFGREDETHAWFTSFGPFEAPELVITLLLERGGAGDIDAAPIARDIWNWWAVRDVTEP